MFNLASKARPYFGAVVLTAGLLTAGGIYSATRMPSGVYPEVTFPRIAVVAKKPGLDLRQMELQVTRPLEQAVSYRARRRARSAPRPSAAAATCPSISPPAPTWCRRCSSPGTASAPPAARLPPDVELTVEQMTPSVFPIMSVVLTGGDSPAQLRDYAFYELAPQIKTIPDVLYANVAGGDLREIEVVARPDTCWPPTCPPPTSPTRSARCTACSRSAASRSRRSPSRSSSTPRARRPGRSRTWSSPPRTASRCACATWPTSRCCTRTACTRSASRARTPSWSPSSASRAATRVNISRDRARPAANGSRRPRNIHATVAYDQAHFVNTAVDNVRDAILIGSLFSILILLAFLRSWRATLISALAIPTTLAITFLFLHWVGETLNLMSLGGLAVAIGLIIDDTVVVIENIARHLTKATRDRRVTAQVAAAVDPVDAASAEITGAVIGSTLTTVLVFVPLAFIAGVYGQFFASLSWSLSIAVLVSMVISLTLVPVFAARFLAGRPMPRAGADLQLYRRPLRDGVRDRACAFRG